MGILRMGCPQGVCPESFREIVPTDWQVTHVNGASRVFEGVAASRIFRFQDGFVVRHPNLVPVHTPVHASWLNQIEIYFSIVHRKALTPNDFSLLEEVDDRLLRFRHYYETIATPFEWKFTRGDLAEPAKKSDRLPVSLRPVA